MTLLQIALICFSQVLILTEAGKRMPGNQAKRERLELISSHWMPEIPSDGGYHDPKWPDCCSFFDLGKLFICSGCEPLLTEIPEDVPDNAEVIGIIGNALTELPTNAFSKVLPQLGSLNLPENQISYIDPNVLREQLPSLRFLDLEDNQLTDVPQFLPTTLEGMGLHGNILEKLTSEAFREVPLLTSLTVSAKETGPDIFEGLSLLTTENLVLDTCKMGRYTFRGSTFIGALDLLDVCPNYLDPDTGLMLNPFAFAEFTGARLNIEDSRISQIRWKAFTNMPQTTAISLLGNDLEAIESGAFSNIPEIRNIAIGMCDKATALKINQGIVDNAPNGFLNLESFSISGCNFESIEEHTFGVAPIGKTISIALNDNELTTLDPDVLLADEGSFNSIRMDGNPYNCDCNLRWLVGFLNQYADIMPEVTEVRCEFPINLRGVSIMNVNEEDMIC